MVDAVATQGYRLLRRALREQLAIDFHPGVLMEIEGRSFLDGQGSHTIHLDSAIDDNRFLIAIGIRLTKHQFLTSFHLHILQSLGIPRHRPQVDFLLSTTFQGEDQVILNQLRFVLLLQSRSQLHKDTNAITLANLHVTSLIPRCLPEIRSIHIDTEALLVAALQTDIATADTLPRTVVHPHRLGRSRHIRKSRVELHGVGGERQQVRLRDREVLVIHTGRQA